MKVLVLYAYHESPGASTNLEFFDRFGLYRTNDITYCLIINGKTCSINLSNRWSKTVFRENEGYDFAAWNYGLENFDLSEYTHFIFLNDTVRGPFGDRHWIRTFLDLITDDVKLAGITINCHHGLYSKYFDRETVPHVQSMFFCTDRVGLDLIRPKIINGEILDKVQTVIQKELGLSLTILDAGYNITCILPRYQVDFRNPDNQWLNSQNGTHGDVQFEGAYFGRTLHPIETIFFKTNRRINESSLTQLTEAQRKTSFY